MVVELDACHEMPPLIHYEVMNCLHVVVEKRAYKKGIVAECTGYPSV